MHVYMCMKKCVHVYISLYVHQGCYSHCNRGHPHFLLVVVFLLANPKPLGGVGRRFFQGDIWCLESVICIAEPNYSLPWVEVYS